MKKLFGYILVVCLVAAMITGSAFYISTTNQKNKAVYYTSELYVFTPEHTYELKVGVSDKKTKFCYDTEEVLLKTLPSVGKSRIGMPDLSVLEGENTLVDKKAVLDYTYNLSFVESCKYLKYLLDTGYVIERYISNSQYVEVYVLKEAEYKRLIIFKDSLMMCDMFPSAELPDIYSYFEKYDTEGMILKTIKPEFEEEKNNVS